jgi:hypothetical protein
MLNRLRRFWRETARCWWYDYEWPVIGIFALTAVVLGVVGFRLQFLTDKKPVEWVDLIFKSFQLFVLQISVDPPMPWQLNAARVLAPLVAAYTALQALAELFADQMRSLRLRFRRGHVVICGLGRKGLILSRGFLERGQTVVVIEQDAENDLVRQCRDLGGVVLIGDAVEPWLLRKAGVGRARYLFAVCGDDGTNAEVAVRAAELLDRNPGAQLICAVHIFDPQLCTLLRERELDAGSADRLRLEFFNVYDLGARVLLEENPPAVPSNHLVIVGMGHLGESLLVNVSRQWCATGAAADAKLHVTLIDLAAQEIAGKLLARYPGLKKYCELTPLDMDVHSGTFQQADFLSAASPGGAPARVFICLDDDSVSLAAALALVRRNRDQQPAIVVRMAQNAGLAVLLRGAGEDAGTFQHLRAFGMLDRTCHPDQVLRGTHEILARAIHEDYLRQQRAAGVKPEQNSSMVPWDALPKHLQESNRQQADDIGVKLRAVCCRAVPLLDWDEPLFEFTSDEIDRLAILEHDRWLAAKRQDGWRHGLKKDNDAKTHPCLVPYAQLPPDEQEKDRNAVRQIPAMLAKVGFRIHRLDPQHHEDRQTSP